MSSRSLTIVVAKGPGAGAEVALGSRGLTIGSDPTSDLVLSGDDFVTPQHARIVWSDRGAVLRNQSPNGTLVNGRSVNEVSLTSGDTISIGLRYLLAVKAPPPAVAVPPSSSSSASASAPPISSSAAGVAAATAAASATPAIRVKLPIWLIAYLGLMVVAFVFFGVMKLRGSSEPGFVEITKQEQAYATSRKYAKSDTDRVMRLLAAAAVHEQRGDERSAYEIYREVLSVRRPVDPRAPAYRYAAGRAARLAPR